MAWHFLELRSPRGEINFWSFESNSNYCVAQPRTLNRFPPLLLRVRREPKDTEKASPRGLSHTQFSESSHLNHCQRLSCYTRNHQQANLSFWDYFRSYLCHFDTSLHYGHSLCYHRTTSFIRAGQLATRMCQRNWFISTSFGEYWFDWSYGDTVCWGWENTDGCVP